MADQHNHHDREPGRASVALFRSKAEAREAIAALHKAHYTHTWLGTVSLAESDGGGETITVEAAAGAGGFFSGTQSLVDALVAHGISGETAREIEEVIEPGDALVTVDPKDHDVVEALTLMQRHGGSVAGPGARSGAESWLEPMPAPADAAEAAALEEQAFYRRSAVRR